jgi:CRISPR-associated protein Cst2
MNKGLTLTVVFQAQSLNFGEGIANISELKKLTRGDGNLYTFASRQCLRYDIVRLGSMFYNWNTQVVDKSKGTVQFRDDCTIKDSEEMDLFGYMKTAKKMMMKKVAQI